ncbi:MAG: hypothetical protein ACRDHY_18470 [Anaerolineales bacterium]
MDTEAIADRISAGDPVSRDEAEAYIRAIERRCLGTAMVPTEVQRSFFDRFGAGEPAADLLAEFERIAPPTLRRFAVARLANRGSAEDTLIDALRAHQADVGQPCGRDFNEEILGYPFDGEEREYECPRCGVRGTFRSPRIALTDDA